MRYDGYTKKMTEETHIKLGESCKNIETLFWACWSELNKHYPKTYPIHSRWKQAHKAFNILRSALDDLACGEHPIHDDAIKWYYGRFESDSVRDE